MNRVVEEVEDMFLEGNFEGAYESSRDFVMVELDSNGIDQLSDAVVDVVLEVNAASLAFQNSDYSRAMAIYLQCISELQMEGDDLLEPAVLLQTISPLPFDFGLMWIKILIAHQTIDNALPHVSLLREQLRIKLATSTESTDVSLFQYCEIIDLLVFDIWPATLSPKATREDIQQDEILSDTMKQEYILAMDACAQPEEETAPISEAVRCPSVEKTPTQGIRGPVLVTAAVVACVAAVCTIRYRPQVKTMLQRLGTRVENATDFFFG